MNSTQKQIQLICFVALAFMSLATRASGGILFGPVTNSVNNHVYYLLTPDTWIASQAEAVRLGGNLATINDEAEQNWVYQTFSGTNRNLWIGLADQSNNGVFSWADGEAVNYTNWAENEPSPDEQYVHMVLPGHSHSGKWNNRRDGASFLDNGTKVFLYGVVEIAHPLTTINFDDFVMTQSPISFASSNRYESLGIVFSQDIPIRNARREKTDDIYTAFVRLGGSSNVLGLVENILQIDATFTIPGTRTPATTDLVRALFFDTAVATTLASILAFDSFGSLVASNSVATPSSYGAVLEVRAAGIARVRFSSDADGAYADNIQFNPPTPSLAFQVGRLRLSSIQGFRLNAFSILDRTVHIEASTNFRDWTTVALFPKLTNSVEFIDLTATNYNFRFYRAVVP